VNSTPRIAPSHEPGLPQRLAGRLKRALPGAAVQSLYQPQAAYGRHFGPPPASARPAAVLVLLYCDDGAWHLPLTLRPDYLADHAGQISLPGGAVEPGESSELAAIRELNEELGVDARSIELLGELSPIYLFRSNYSITPWLAVTRSRPNWQPNPAEVAELVALPLAVLLDPKTTTVEVWQDQGVAFQVPALRYQGHVIWGATAMILAELAALALEAPS
jgi:8-oxo-dGTP pyrophosphatase MutT (NUDIX family)